VIKKVNENNTNINTYYLSGGFQYEEIITSTTSQMPQLKFFPHAEGYVNVEQGRSTSYFNYVFNYTDHLGNIRLSYAYDPSIQTTKIIEENHYYAFGLKHTGYNSDLLLWMEDIDTDRISLQQSQIKTAAPAFVPKSSGYQYKYNGKELQTELGLNMYDYGWRNYDAALGRFNKMDRFSEKYYNNSTYNYAGNNPIIFVDIQGDSIGLGNECFQAFRNTVADNISSNK
jgi:RHS repeat-associated protein